MWVLFIIYYFWNILLAMLKGTWKIAPSKIAPPRRFSRTLSLAVTLTLTQGGI